MADEPEVVVDQPGDVSVEVTPDNEKPGKPQLTDEQVAELAEPPSDDEIGSYAKDAQRRIKNLHLASQEWRRRVVQSSKDVATATTLAEQLYRENQELKTNMGRSEQALIEQAIQRAEAQLAQAKARAKAAYAVGDPDGIVSANEEVSSYVAEADRLYHIWDLVRDAGSDCYYVTYRRQALAALREAIGRGDYYRGVLPPHVPVWRFGRRD